MTEHLPECPPMANYMEPDECAVCEALRACEARLRADGLQESNAEWVRGHAQGVAEGQASALGRALVAVRVANCGWPDDLSQHAQCDCREVALRAVYALQEE